MILPMQTFSGLADGVYTFSARTAGAYAGYQSSVQFTVGAVAPRTSIVAAPVATSSAVTTLRTARFVWVSSGDVTFGCSLVRAGAAGAYAPCVSPQCVRCPDTPHALRAWQLQTCTMLKARRGTKPRPVARPDADAVMKKSHTRVAVGHAVPCVRSAPSASCRGIGASCCIGLTVSVRRSYPDLADGRYTFGVYGTSSAGVAGAPALVDFTVDTTAPTTQLAFTPACAAPYEFSFQILHLSLTGSCSLTQTWQKP